MASRRGPDNSVRVSISGTMNGVNWANVFHAQLTTSGTITQADLDSWLNTFQTNYKTRFGPTMHASVSFVLAKAVLYTPGGGELISQVSMTGSGSSGGTAIADNSVSKVVSWLTTVYWRGGKPRTYIPGVSTAEVTANNALTAAQITTLTTAGTNFRTDTNAQTVGTITGTSLGFVSFRSGNAERGTPIFFSVTGAKVHPRLGTQRRRLGKWVA